MPIPTSFVQAISLCSCGPSRFQELHLQHLIAENPGLLPSDNRPEQRRWLLVTRELPITAEGTSFSLDHLFLDEDGVPTLVESKLASNPQHRREVIGQALDYASWFAFDGSEVIRRYLVARCGDAADDEVREAFGTDDEDEFDVEAYWRRVDDQLRQGRMRLLFVGDSVSPLVRRVTEFLNRELRNVDVLAVEYAVWGDDAETRVLVPTVHGLSVDKRASSGPATPARVWTEEEWLAAFEQRNGVGISNGARRLIERWRGNESAGFHVVAGPGVGNNPAFHLYLVDAAKNWAPAIRILSTALRVPTDSLEKRHSWIGEDASMDFLKELGSAAGIDVDPGNMAGRLTLPLTILGEPGRVEALGDVLDRWAEHLKRVGRSD